MSAARAIISVGANQGLIYQTIVQVLTEMISEGLSSTIKIIGISNFYWTRPWGVLQQPPYLNLALEIITSITPEDLLNKLLELEADLGRNRSTGQRWSPRRIDLDLIFYEQEIRTSDFLKLPHPRFSARGFVVQPVMEIIDSKAPYYQQIVQAYQDLTAKAADEIPQYRAMTVRTAKIPVPPR